MTILYQPLIRLAQILKLRNDFLSSIDYTDEFLRKRKERQKKAKKRRLIAWFIFIMILLVAVGVILSFTVLFPIKNLTFTGSNIYSSQQIMDASGIDVGDNLFNISKEKTLNKLKANLPFIETVKFERNLPDTLKVTVTDAEKYACYQVGNKYYTVSYDGWVLQESKSPTENVFLVIAKGVKCKVGSALEFENEKTKEKIENIVNYLNKEKISIDYINVTNDVNLTVGVEKRFEVEFGTENSLEAKIKHLKSTINSMDKSKSGRIDLSVWNNQNKQGIFVENNTK